MSNWDFLNLGRVRDGFFGTSPEDGFNGMFEFWPPGSMSQVKCIASDGEGWRHVSVSLVSNPFTCPRWDVMCVIKDLFWEDTDWVVQFHPPKSEYVNNHPGCLHLWQCTDGRAQPIPPSWMVGIKGTHNMTHAGHDEVLILANQPNQK